MIKIKILNATKGRNEPTFRPFWFIKDKLRDYSIDITESNDYDYLFVGMEDFINKKLNLKESINYGLENLSKITGDYFLFEGSDSTSLMGSFEVFDRSNAIYLFKNQILSTKEQYEISYPHGKWFWEGKSDLDLSYKMSKNKWDKIKLTGWNLGQLLPNFNHFYPINNNKTLDICAAFKGEHEYNEDHKSQNNHFYQHHRNGLWDKLKKLNKNYNIIHNKLPKQEYLKSLHNSKITISPFGMGELCFRDFECMQFGTIILKPNQDIVHTIPNIYEEGKTYIGCKYDWSDLEEKIDYILSNFNELNEKINLEIRNQFVKGYDYDKLCLYWYNIFSNLNNVKKVN